VWSCGDYQSGGVLVVSGFTRRDLLVMAHTLTQLYTSATTTQVYFTEAPSPVWHDTTATLDAWAIEDVEILNKIFETKRKEPRETS
jgi:hypothetical protein